MVVFPVDQRAADEYGRLRATLIAHFGPREKARRKSIRIERLGFSDNDIWIAAVAKAYGLTILSSDSDFPRMAEAVDLRVENWLGYETTDQ